MTVESVSTLIVSALALLISVYGVLERRAVQNRATRLRLTELLDELNALTVDAMKLGEDSELPDGELELLRSAITNRRAMLAAQATHVLRQYHGRLSASEYIALADAYVELGDPDQARSWWEQAVARPAEATALELAAGWRGLAWCCFDQGDVEQARMAARMAVDARPGTSDHSCEDRLATLLYWLEAEQELDPPDSGIQEALRTQADAEVARIRSPERREAAAQRFAAGAAPAAAAETGTA